MNPHLVIARKHRPRHLRDLVGQEAVVRILENSMRAGRTAHAYLLVGPRGVGKTSTARIMAMSFNAPTGEGGEYDPSSGDFLEIAEGRHPDVLELDAATHSGVDRIRDILGEAAFSPTRLRYRIFLIDEVHMLSQSAFNALLKTLEEPPPRVKFILATTEARKVPITIQSRCQKLKMNLIPETVIAESLSRIAQLDGFRLEAGAALAIAEASGGSMRDAQTALEQIVAFTEGKVTEREVADLWGGLPQSDIHDMAGHILRGDSARVWEALEVIARRGKDHAMIAAALLQLLRKVQREIYDGAREPATGLREYAPPRKLLTLIATLDHAVSRLESCLDPAGILTQWALEACECARRPDLLDLVERLTPEEKQTLQAILERIAPA
jgi:DNA polymerase-3 subunit gamma/tau